MRIRTLASACAALVLAWSAGSVAEPQLASPSDGRAMLDRAIAALKADEATALKAFNDEKNKDFRDRDLYVYCFSLPDGNITAYQSPVMIGTNVKEFEASPEQSRWPTRLRCDHKGRRRRDCQLYLRFPQAGHQGTHAQGNARSPSRQAGLRRQLFQGVALLHHLPPVLKSTKAPMAWIRSRVFPKSLAAPPGQRPPLSHRAPICAGRGISISVIPVTLTRTVDDLSAPIS
jgi:hypothetical protein